MQIEEENITVDEYLQSEMKRHADFVEESKDEYTKEWLDSYLIDAHRDSRAFIPIIYCGDDTLKTSKDFVMNDEKARHGFPWYAQAMAYPNALGFLEKEFDELMDYDTNVPVQAWVLIDDGITREANLICESEASKKTRFKELLGKHNLSMLGYAMKELFH